MTAAMGWVAGLLAGATDVWALAWLIIRYVAQFSFIISATGFFIVLIRKVSRFVDTQDAIAKDAKKFAEATNKILESLITSRNEHATDIAVIKHHVGLDAGASYEGEERRRRPHRRGDADKRRSDDDS
jgi:hypothetical protein